MSVLPIHLVNFMWTSFWLNLKKFFNFQEFRGIVNIVSLLALFFTIFLLKISDLPLEKIIIRNHDNIQIYKQHYARIIKSPFEKETYDISGVIKHYWYSQNKTKLVIDDCLVNLTINERTVFVLPQSSPLESPDDCQSNLAIDWKPYLTEKINKVELKIFDRGWKFGVKNQRSLQEPIYRCLLVLLVIEILYFGQFFLQKLKVDLVSQGIIGLGVLTRFAYLHYTDAITRGYDAEAHLEYFEYIKNHHSLPSLHACWECHQQPFFYVLLTIIAKIANFFQVRNYSDIYQIFQIFSLILSLGFIWVGYQILKQIFAEKIYLYLGLAMLNFYPSGIIHSVRVSNDSLLYFFLITSLYYLILWWNQDKLKDLYQAILFSAFALLTKSNGLFGFVIIFFALILKKYYNQNYKIIRSTLFFLTSFIGALLTSIYRNFKEMKLGKILNIPENQLDNKLIVGNDFHNYVTFDFSEFLTIPNINPWENEGGREFFWNYLLKSSLFGEFTINNVINQKLALWMSFFLIVILAYCIIGLILVFSSKSSLKLMIPFLLQGSFLLFSVIYLRHSMPYSPHNDFRFIFPIIISGIVIYVWGVKECQNVMIFPWYGKIIHFLGYSSGIALSVASMIFFLVPLFLGYSF